jgi:outer membrane protein insertion porin family
MFSNKTKKILGLAILGLIPDAILYAGSSEFIVKEIDVEGLQRISIGSVYNNLPIQIGQSITPSDTSEAISDLYNSGNFSNIKIYRKNDDLIVQVKERPAISSVDFSGNDDIKSEDLRKALVSSGLEVGNIFNPDILQMVKQSLEQQYFSLGKYAAKIDIKVTKLARNRVAIRLNISEGKTAKIDRINFIKNKNFSQGVLKDEIILTIPSMWNLWGLITSDDQYSIQRMQASLEKLRSYYMNRGYLNFRVDSSQVALNPDKDKTFITMNLSEGKIFHVKAVALEGKFILPEAVLREMIDIQPGDVFSRQKILDSADKIKYELGNKGYAFANVNPVPDVDQKDLLVGLTFYVTPGKKVYVRQVNFLGNNVTNDVVYRQNMLYSEGGLYNQYMIEQSKIRLQRLPYVENIDMKKIPVAGTDDLIDLNYEVKERSANTVSASLGYSQLYKFMIGGNLAMPNVLGTGNQFNIGAQLSIPYKSLNLSYTMPFFTDSGISQTVGAYLTNVNTQSTTLTSYATNSYGLTLGYIIPISLNNSISVGVGYDHTMLMQNGSNSLTVRDFVDKNGSEYNAYTANIGFIHNTTNRAFFPTEGNYFNVNANAAIPGSTLTWYKLGISNNYYFPISKSFTLSVNGGAQYGNGYGGLDQLPFFDNFIGGGWGSVRGYNQGGLGPRDTLTSNTAVTSTAQCTETDVPAGSGDAPGCSEGNSLGGNLNLFANFDLLFPVPGVDDSSNMRLGVFFDAGNVYSTYDVTTAWNISQPTAPTLGNLVYSVGLEFLWLSPLGPLAFSLAKPINTQPGSQTQIFQFNLGQTF